MSQLEGSPLASLEEKCGRSLSNLSLALLLTNSSFQTLRNLLLLDLWSSARTCVTCVTEGFIETLPLHGAHRDTPVPLELWRWLSWSQRVSCRRSIPCRRPRPTSSSPLQAFPALVLPWPGSSGGRQGGS